MPLSDNAARRLSTALADSGAGAEVAAAINGLAPGNNNEFTGSGNVTMSSGQRVQVINKGTGAATTVTLPPTPSTWQSALVADGKGDGATHNITVQGASAATIDGASTAIIASNWGAMEFLWDGTEWKLIGNLNFTTGGNLNVPGTLKVVGAATLAKLNVGPAPTDTFAATMTIDVTKTLHVIAASHTTSATVTMTPSAAGTAGDILEIVTEADSSGTVTATFASTFHPTATQVTTLSTFSTIRFISDGTRWIETGRTTAVS